MFLLAGISVLCCDHAELPAPNKISPYVLHSPCMEVNDVGEHPFTWLIKDVIQYRLQKLKPDNKRCFMDEWKDCRAQQDPCLVFNRNCGQIIDTKHSLLQRLWSHGLEKTEETLEFLQACQTFGRHTNKSNKSLFYLKYNFNLIGESRRKHYSLT